MNQKVTKLNLFILFQSLPDLMVIFFIPYVFTVLAVVLWPSLGASDKISVFVYVIILLLYNYVFQGQKTIRIWYIFLGSSLSLILVLLGYFGLGGQISRQILHGFKLLEPVLNKGIILVVSTLMLFSVLFTVWSFISEKVFNYVSAAGSFNKILAVALSLGLLLVFYILFRNYSFQLVSLLLPLTSWFFGASLIGSLIIAAFKSFSEIKKRRINVN